MADVMDSDAEVGERSGTLVEETPKSTSAGVEAVVEGAEAVINVVVGAPENVVAGAPESPHAGPSETLRNTQMNANAAGASEPTPNFVPWLGSHRAQMYASPMTFANLPPPDTTIYPPPPAGWQPYPSGHAPSHGEYIYAPPQSPSYGHYVQPMYHQPPSRRKEVFVAQDPFHKSKAKHQSLHTDYPERRYHDTYPMGGRETSYDHGHYIPPVRQGTNDTRPPVRQGTNDTRQSDANPVPHLPHTVVPPVVRTSSESVPQNLSPSSTSNSDESSVQSAPPLTRPAYNTLFIPPLYNDSYSDYPPFPADHLIPPLGSIHVVKGYQRPSTWKPHFTERMRYWYWRICDWIHPTTPTFRSNGFLFVSPCKPGALSIALEFTTRKTPTNLYLLLLLFLPSFYFSRVARLFEEAELAMPEIEQMAIKTSLQAQNFMDERAPNEHELFPLQWVRLKTTWESFIDSLLREWKTLNVISALLLSAILTILQIEDAANDYVTRYTALLSLVCSLVSLLFGCIYIIRFATMRKTYKAAEWALEAQESGTSTWWNVFILLALPAIWLTWSILLYIACIMSYIWRTAPNSQKEIPELSAATVFKIRIGITILLALALVYSCFILATFRRYGSAMDKKWASRIERWRTKESGMSMYYPSGEPGEVPPSPYANPFGAPRGTFTPGHADSSEDGSEGRSMPPQVRFRDSASFIHSPTAPPPHHPPRFTFSGGEQVRSRDSASPIHARAFPPTDPPSHFPLSWGEYYREREGMVSGTWRSANDPSGTPTAYGSASAPGTYPQITADSAARESATESQSRGARRMDSGGTSEKTPPSLPHSSTGLSLPTPAAASARRPPKGFKSWIADKISFVGSKSTVPMQYPGFIPPEDEESFGRGISSVPDTQKTPAVTHAPLPSPSPSPPARHSGLGLGDDAPSAFGASGADVPRTDEVVFDRRKVRGSVSSLVPTQSLHTGPHESTPSVRRYSDDDDNTRGSAQPDPGDRPSSLASSHSSRISKSIIAIDSTKPTVDV